jgi:hypothetical protein
MAGGGNLFGRVLSYVVNEFIVEGLANKYDPPISSLSSPLPLSSDPSVHVCEFVFDSIDVLRSVGFRENQVPDGVVISLS